MKVFMDLEDEMKDYNIWKALVLPDLLDKHFSHYHEDVRWIKYIILNTINNYNEKGLEFIERLFNEAFEKSDSLEQENIMTGIFYCLKYIEYDKIKDIAIPMFKKALKIDNGDIQEILIMMYYDEESLWKYDYGIELLEKQRPFKRKYLENYFEEIKTRYKK